MASKLEPAVERAALKRAALSLGMTLVEGPTMTKHAADARTRSDFSQLGQHADLTELWTIVDATDARHTVRLRLRSDSYRDQCYAIAERWDGAKWQPVYTIAPAGMATPEGLAYARPSATALSFRLDVEALLDAVRLVVGA